MGNTKNLKRKIKRALISVSNKENLNKLLNVLKKFDVEIFSSGGTHKEIKKLGFKSKEVSEYTNYPEILGGRVKTIHPMIHGGILMKRNNKIHKKESLKNNFLEIDLVVVNFYPFEKVIRETNNQNKIVENIDIGGPALVRGAAKNYNDVAVITNADQYDDFISEITKYNGYTSIQFREKFSSYAFSETGYYDSLISNHFNNYQGIKFPRKKLISANLVEKLRYGENPHQEAAIYASSLLDIEKISGKELSFNNYNDIFAALNISKSLPKNRGTVIVKHTNPCGVSAAKIKVDSFKLALKCDPISAFGGVVSCNFKIDRKVALEINKMFFEVIVANGFDNAAINILRKKKNLRLINAKKLSKNFNQSISTNFNALITQTSDNKEFLRRNFRVVSKKKPNKKTFDNLIFAFNICRFVKSNAIVIANKDSIVGIGSGQPSRLDSCNIAINKFKKFQDNLQGEIIAASDAFFPFVDGFEKLVQAGVTAIIQPAGSIRDNEIIKFANETGTKLVFSNTRHFKH